MSNFVTRFIWLDKTGKMIEQITDYKNSKKEEDVPCVLLVGPKPYVDKLLTRLMDYDA